MLISKKELLAVTGISYGQLYRWKREHLIPEEWFIKQSSFTGQETFFPKDQILNRVRTIQELKDNYSLEELAKLFSPDVNGGGYALEELSFMDEMNEELIRIYQDILEKNTVSYLEVIVLVIVSKLKEELELTNSQIENMLNGLKANLEEIKSTGYILALLRNDNEYYTIIYQDQTQIYYDQRCNIIRRVRIHDVSNQLKIKYRSYFESQNDNFDKVNPINEVKNDVKQDNLNNVSQQENNNQNENTNHSDTTEQNDSMNQQLNVEQDENMGQQENTNQKETAEQQEYTNSNQDRKNNNRDEKECIFKFNNWEVRL